MPGRVLIVDDESDLAELVSYNLTRAGYKTSVAHDGVSGLRGISEHKPDLVILDVMMPGLTGHEVLSRVRRDPATAELPVILLTAKSEECDELEGLAHGADDYVTKPFSMKVLEARIESVLRRTTETPSESDQISLGPITICKGTHEARLDNAPLSLTVTEFRLLSSLAEARGKVLTRKSLIKMAMGAGVTITERTVDVHINSIRRKLGDRSAIIKTVRGVGYRTDTETTDKAATDPARSSQTPR